MPKRQSMDINFFTANLSNPGILIPRLYKEWKSYYEYKAFREYDPKHHKVNDPAYRRDKWISIPDPRGGNDAQGQPIMTTDIVRKARLAIPYQQVITLRKTAFTTGGKLTYKSSSENDAEKATIAKVLDTLKKNKVDYLNPKIVKSLLSQTECAEIWYSEVKNGKAYLKCNVYSPSDGSDLIPVFDGNDNLIAFGRAFKGSDDNIDYSNLYLYTEENLLKYRKARNGEWGLFETVKNIYGKIPVIYYSLEKSAWEIVQPLIERLETLISNHADMNDYNGSPILLASGDIVGWSEKGESGKVIQAKEGADVKYVTWDSAPESIKLEAETLHDLIHTMTQTANLSMAQMTKLSGTTSGEALERMMMDAHLGAKELQGGVYGLGIQRRLNFLKTASSNIYKECVGGDEAEITPQFGLFRLDSTKSDIENALLANGGKVVIDELGGISMAGLTDDPVGTLKLIKSETSTSQTSV